MDSSKQNQNQSSAAMALLESAATAHWSFINEWKVEPQSDDRPMMSAEVTPGGASPSAQRSTARRQHQATFKKWSQSRHD